MTVASPMPSATQTTIVTGGAGFLGSAVVRKAVARGDRVVSLVRDTSKAIESTGLERVAVNWSDPVELASILARLSPNAIVHCAGASGRRGEHASALYDANARLVWTLLAAARESSPGASIVLISTAAVYGTAPTVPTPESAPLTPVGHYATSKVLAERIAKAFVDADGSRVCVARPFNVLGPGEPDGSVVSTIVGQLMNAKAGDTAPVRVREIASVRDFVDIEDVAAALLLLCNAGAPGEAYNVCSGRGTGIADLIRIACDVSGRKADLDVADPDAPGTVSIGSCDKLKRLGWNPGVEIDESLARIRPWQAEQKE